MKHFGLFLCLLTLQINAWGWGFRAHRQINRYAVFTLPPAMFTFYKYHLHFITENAVNPDKRRYAIEGEAPRHYIDLDYYGDSTLWPLLRYWKQALEWYPADTLIEHGILPWHIYRVKDQLTAAFRQKEVTQILRLSADIGHYIADAHVPLHTTENYNGQFTDQEGIHGLWETRLPELWGDSYDFFVGTAAYVVHPQQQIWKAIIQSHRAVDRVLHVEKELTKNFPSLQKYSFEQQGGRLKKVYALDYAKAYHTMLEGQVERQMRSAIKMIGDFWFTCWVDAGQPDLAALLALPLPEAQLKETFSQEKALKVRDCGE